MDKKKVVLLLDGALLVAAALVVPLAKWMLWALPDCSFAKIGVLCPSCGGTRCVRAFFSGDFGAAFSFNPFFFVLICYLAAALVLLNVGVLLKVKWADRAARAMTSGAAVIIAAVAFAIFGVVRNFV
jgi:hypothetical protein